MLTNPKRKISYNIKSYKCDNSKPSWSSYLASDWQGPNWYRISPSIGTKIPTSPTKQRHCGTGASGWIDGPSTPSSIGQIIDSKVCFSIIKNDGKGDQCFESVAIKIRNCGSYLLYYLPNTLGCWRGYCVE